jgi:hypothetical protein
LITLQKIVLDIRHAQVTVCPDAFFQQHLLHNGNGKVTFSEEFLRVWHFDAVFQYFLERTAE